MAKILVVDDDQKLRESLRFALACEGYNVKDAPDGKTALQSMALFPPDLVVLDIRMPGLDGLEVCRRIRQGSKTPILMLTAQDSIGNRVEGLDQGADDYLVKPFALEELLARVRSLLRRQNNSQQEQPVYKYADVSLDNQRHEVYRGTRKLKLAPRTYDLLHVLISSPERVFSRQQLLTTIWNYPESSRVLDVYVGYLRDQLESNDEPKIVQTVRGVGYMLSLTPAD